MEKNGIMQIQKIATEILKKNGRVKEFKSFQAMFAKNIREQGWLDVKPQITVSPGKYEDNKEAAP